MVENVAGAAFLSDSWIKNFLIAFLLLSFIYYVRNRNEVALKVDVKKAVVLDNTYPK